MTKAIAGLEEMLGVKLFDRFAHGVEPTVHGLSFAPRAIAIFDELLGSGIDGSLHVGITEMPAIPFLPVAVNRMIDVAPNIFVSIIEDGTRG